MASGIDAAGADGIYALEGRLADQVAAATCPDKLGYRTAKVTSIGMTIATAMYRAGVTGCEVKGPGHGCVQRDISDHGLGLISLLGL